MDTSMELKDSPPKKTNLKTTEYHAKLYSDHKRLQTRFLQQKPINNTEGKSSNNISNDNNESSVKISLPATFTFETPNLYKTSLKLSKEININGWWAAIIDLFTSNSFHATHITLCIPQDASDPYNGPWGLKAVYECINVLDNKAMDNNNNNDNSETKYSNKLHSSDSNNDNHNHSHIKNNNNASNTQDSHHINKCYDRLQPLDLVSVPLINNSSVQLILKRNDIVVLSREYRTQSSFPLTPRRHFKKHIDDGQDMVKRALLEKRSNLRLSLNNQGKYLKDDIPDETEKVPPFLPSQYYVMDYDEYEQQQPSPWSRSPAPSPALMDPEVNPFFQSPPKIDDDAFNPDSSESFTSSTIAFPPPASNAHSLVHIPIMHPPDLDNDKENSLLNNRAHGYPTPIGILSFLSPVVPYPPALLQCIKSLQAFIATSLSNALAYSRILQSQFTSITTASATTSATNVPSRQPLRRRHSHKIKRKTSFHNFTGYTTNPSPPSSSYCQKDLTLSPSPSSSTSSISKSKIKEFLDQNGIIKENLDNGDDLNSINDLNDYSVDLDNPIRSEDIDKFLQSTSTCTTTTTTTTATASIHTDILHDIDPEQLSFYKQQHQHQQHDNNVDIETVLFNMVNSELHNYDDIDESSYNNSNNNNNVIIEKNSNSNRNNNSNKSNNILDQLDGTSLENDYHNSKPQHLNQLSTSPTQLEEDHLSIINNNKPLNKSSPSSSATTATTNAKTLLRKPSHRNRRSPVTSMFIRSKRRGSSSPNRDSGCNMRRIKSRESIDKLLETPRSSLLRLVIDGIPIHVFTCSTRTGQVTWVNNRILQYTGRPLQEHLGPGWLSHMHPDDQTDCRQAWEKAFELGNGFAGEYRLRRFDDVYRIFLWRIVPLRDIKGRIIHWFGTCTDVHDQQLAKENSLRQMEIESNERKYRLLAEAIPQIVFTFSPGIGLTYANGKWESYSNQPFERTKGFGFMSQVHPEDRHQLQLPDLSPQKTAGISWHTEIRLLGSDNTYRWFLVKCISVDELETGEVRWFGTCTDINDHKLLEHKLKEAHNAAQKSTESKTRFLSNMSHEIRTPLIGITGMLNFLLDTDLTVEQLDYVHTIQQSAESLLVVINDILDLSKVEAGMMKLEKEPFSLITMIEDANELLSTLAIQKGLELSFWVDDDVPLVVIGDRVRLRQVLLNLIGNAIKFTNQGEVYTQCTVKEWNKQNSEIILLFEVVDTGTGFDSDGEAVMFKPFSQVDSSSTRKHGGSGLGLVISRQLIELHGGEMKCTSKKGHGSTFYFTVNFKIPAANTRPQPQTPQSENIDPFFRTDPYTVVHDQAYRQELLKQQRQQLEQEANVPDGIQQKQQSQIPVLFDASEISTFSPSPLAHSKKHSQANEIPTSIDQFRDILYNKSLKIQLQPPPKRKGVVIPSVQKKETFLSSSTPTTPLISLQEASSVPKSAKGILSANNKKSFKPTSIPDLLSPSTAVILPPRTPTRLSPLRILIVCEWSRSCTTMKQHVCTIISKLSSQQHYSLDITQDAIQAQQHLSDENEFSYDYIMINLRSERDILKLTSCICTSTSHHNANILIVTTPMQRSLIMEYADANYESKNVIPRNCGFVFKPLKRSKLNWYFGVRGTTNTNQSINKMEGSSSAPDASHRTAATQKEVFRKMEADVGGKGFRILLVEDNLVNQKVLTRYLVKVGLLVDVANDGEECVKQYTGKPYGYYSLILSDLFMPIKDGYEATKEIREWEEKNITKNQRPIPIVALSANVMSNVANKCLECGFSTYISKPVNFAILSDVIRSYLLPRSHIHL